ncbi:hypothetical protein [Dactylosporangium sp. CA-092794]|uniref:hypothetical protein n=1 Tax=Dactylosporangium sp. CA-092794 TaxID=3239929 RepID=UPI003D93CEDE
MATYMMNPDGASDVATSLKAITERLGESLQALGSQVSAFNQANAGNAIQSYDEAHATWTRGYLRMHAAIQNATPILTGIVDRTVATDLSGAQRFASLA